MNPIYNMSKELQKEFFCNVLGEHTLENLAYELRCRPIDFVLMVRERGGSNDDIMWGWTNLSGPEALNLIDHGKDWAYTI